MIKGLDFSAHLKHFLFKQGFISFRYCCLCFTPRAFTGNLKEQKTPLETYIGQSKLVCFAACFTQLQVNRLTLTDMKAWQDGEYIARLFVNLCFFSTCGGGDCFFSLKTH